MREKWGNKFVLRHVTEHPDVLQMEYLFTEMCLINRSGDWHKGRCLRVTEAEAVSEVRETPHPMRVRVKGGLAT